MSEDSNTEAQVDTLPSPDRKRLLHAWGLGWDAHAAYVRPAAAEIDRRLAEREAHWDDSDSEYALCRAATYAAARTIVREVLTTAPDAPGELAAARSALAACRECAAVRAGEGKK